MLNRSALNLTRRSGRIVLGAVLAAPFFALSLAAQQTGPLPPTPSTDAGRAPVASATPAPPPHAVKNSTSDISKDPPSIPVEQIIQKFGEREEEFRKERDNYTYTQTFVVQTIDADDRPDGEYRMTSDILFTPDGKRYEKVTSAPPPTLQRISLSQQDLDHPDTGHPFW